MKLGLFFFLIFFSVGSFLSNCNLNLCDRIGCENAISGINTIKSLPNKRGPTVGIL